MSSSRRKRLVFSGLAVAAILGSSLNPGSSAHADPKQFGAVVGVGSDTIQDIMNAAAGFAGTTAYAPINSGSATGYRQLISFDATVPSGSASTCITAKLNGPAFTRPNGSGAGRKALNASANGTGWTGSAIGALGTCATAVNISGQVDFARSSAGPAAGDTGTQTTYIPFGRDAVSFAYYRAAGSPVTTLSTADLVSLYTTGPQTIGGVRIVPCGIQTGSGTRNFWRDTVIGASDTTMNTATTECDNLLGAAARAEENDGSALKARGDAVVAGSQVIIPFSAASYIAKVNGFAPGTPPTTVGLGSVTGIGLPYTGTVGSGPLAPATAFYNDGVYGRYVYNVLPTGIATGLGNNDVKAIFVGASSAICSASTLITNFGFLTIGATCGSTATKGSYITGQS